MRKKAFDICHSFTFYLFPPILTQNCEPLNQGNMNEIKIAIIGGGVIGCAVARELSREYDDIFLFEKNPGITQGENQSSRNSGVIHSGIYYDQETRPNKAKFCVEGNRLLYEFCEQHKVPFIKTGKIIVAIDEKEEEILQLYLERADINHVTGVTLINGLKVRELEPNVRAHSALLVPSTGIVDPSSLVYRLHTLAYQSGVTFMTGTKVIGLEGHGDEIDLSIQNKDGSKEQVRARAVINAAGVEADRMARLLNPESSYELDPVRGESYKFYSHKRPGLELKGWNVYPTPEVVITPEGRHFTVGVHLTPTFDDFAYPSKPGTTFTVGPKLFPVQDRDNWQKDYSPPGIFFEKVSPFFPELREQDLIWHQAGLQARLKGKPDFIILNDKNTSCFINLLGLDSPGLTSSLAIGKKVAEKIRSIL